MSEIKYESILDNARNFKQQWNNKDQKTKIYCSIFTMLLIGFNVGISQWSFEIQNKEGFICGDDRIIYSTNISSVCVVTHDQGRDTVSIVSMYTIMTMSLFTINSNILLKHFTAILTIIEIMMFSYNGLVFYNGNWVVVSDPYPNSKVVGWISITMLWIGSLMSIINYHSIMLYVMGSGLMLLIVHILSIISYKVKYSSGSFLDSLLIRSGDKGMTMFLYGVIISCLIMIAIRYYWDQFDQYHKLHVFDNSISKPNKQLNMDDSTQLAEAGNDTTLTNPLILETSLVTPTKPTSQLGTLSSGSNAYSDYVGVGVKQKCINKWVTLLDEIKGDSIKFETVKDFNILIQQALAIR